MNEVTKAKEADVRIELGPCPPMTTKIFINGVDVARSCLGFTLSMESQGGVYKPVLTLRMLAKNWTIDGRAKVQVEQLPVAADRRLSEDVQQRLTKAYEAIETEVKA
jgi:hypothetical protein